MLVLLEVEILIRESNSLKDKRRIIKSLSQRLSNSFNISVAEIDFMDLHRRSLLAIAMVSNDKTHLEKIINKIINFIDKEASLEILNINKSFL